MSQDLSLQEILRLAGLLPSYREGEGQGLTLLFRDGSAVWVPKTIRPFIRSLARLFTINLKDARKKYGPILGQVNLVPLALTPFLIFFPVKVRKPLVSGDPAYGYFRLRSVEKVDKEDGNCILVLEGGHRVRAEQSIRTVRSRLRAARKLEESLIDEYCQTLDSNQDLLLLSLKLSK